MFDRPENREKLFLEVTNIIFYKIRGVVMKNLFNPKSISSMKSVVINISQVLRLAKILLLVLFCCPIALAQINDDYDLDEPYDFPLKPGMPEWADLKSHAEMLEVLQIPNDILTRMTTRSLLETCLNYPMFGDVTAYRSMKVGMEILIAHYFNGFPELLKRKDAYIYLSEKFLLFDPLAINEDWSPVEKGGYTFELIKIELLLGQDIILESLSYESKISLLKEAILKKDKMVTKPEYYSVFWSAEQILFLMGKILLKSGNPDISQLVIDDKKISHFLEIGKFESYNDYIDVLNGLLDILDELYIITLPKDIPTAYNLMQNYPNPFNPTTTIQYAIPKDEFVKLTIYDVTGRVIKELVNEYKSAGKYSVKFNASSYSSGIYYYRLEAGEYKSIKKMMLLK
jgi:hypothetical protein